MEIENYHFRKFTRKAVVLDGCWKWLGKSREGTVPRPNVWDCHNKGRRVYQKGVALDDSGGNMGLTAPQT